MTPSLQPLLCSCGKHSARLQPEGMKKRKWEVFEIKKEGNKPRRVTMRAEKIDAKGVVIDLCKGVYQKKNQTAGATTEATRDLRHKDGRNIQYAELNNRATRIAGPGCGHIGKRVGSKDIDAVGEATRVLKKSKPTEKEWRHALGRLTQEHTLLKEWCDKVCMAYIHCCLC
jgi:hypothetical protein